MAARSPLDPSAPIASSAAALLFPYSVEAETATVLTKTRVAPASEQAAASRAVAWWFTS